ncbi:hypothetical protein TNCV_3725821 [Trichonephila clavipes]|nr:hypothetical protein TNCV_3725821 [Trichonephila clavipes]
MRKNEIHVRLWSGSSPDVNSIENVCHILKNRLAKMNCNTTERMIKSAVQVWFHDNEVNNMCAILMESIPRRVEEVIYAIREPTSY